MLNPNISFFYYHTLQIHSIMVPNQSLIVSSQWHATNGKNNIFL